MIDESPPPGSQPPPPDGLTTSDSSYNDQSLPLDPGAPERRKRSGKLCLWLIGIPLILYLGFIAYVSYKAIFGLPHPYKHLYYDETGKGTDGEGRDMAQVVNPMITKDSKFDIIASVWIRDDSIRGKEDGVLIVDFKARPEKLIFTERIFRNLGVDGKLRSTDVELRVPTGHFKQANLSNYDLRASFVLVHSDGHRPSWLDFAKEYFTWKPQSLESPSVRKHDTNQTLEDRIYDSFGITIPLIEFHNITRKEHEDIQTQKTLTNAQPDTDSDQNSQESPPAKGAVDIRRNSFKLEFIGDRLPVTEYHPYVVTRTHLRIMEEDRPFPLSPYLTSQMQVARKTCVKPFFEYPRWYECHRSHRNNGVFETAVELQDIDDSDPEASQKRGNKWLYAPHVSAMVRAAGPMDLVPVPVDREINSLTEGSGALSSDEEHLTITWRLTFSSRPAESLLRLESAYPFTQPSVYNMTETKSTLQTTQHYHDLIVGMFDRVDENAHPRRNLALGIITTCIRMVCWVLAISYWYTRTTTTGISRLGTALICLSIFLFDIEGLTGFTLSGGYASWTSAFWGVPMAANLLKPFVMLVAIMRLEFSWFVKKNNKRRGGKKKSWIPGIHIAHATHSERTSERIEARLSRASKLLLFGTAFAMAYYFITPKAYLLSPKIPPPQEKHPLESYSPHFSTAIELIETLAASSLFTGHVLQFIMNFSSQTYVGDYKITSWLWFICRGVEFFHLLPQFAGSGRGLLVNEGLLFLMAVVNVVQAVKYEYAKSLDGEEVD